MTGTNLKRAVHPAEPVVAGGGRGGERKVRRRSRVQGCESVRGRADGEQDRGPRRIASAEPGGGGGRRTPPAVARAGEAYRRRARASPAFLLRHRVRGGRRGRRAAEEARAQALHRHRARRSRAARPREVGERRGRREQCRRRAVSRSAGRCPPLSPREASRRGTRPRRRRGYRRPPHAPVTSRVGSVVANSGEASRRRGPAAAVVAARRAAGMVRRNMINFAVVSSKLFAKFAVESKPRRRAAAAAIVGNSHSSNE